MCLVWSWDYLRPHCSDRMYMYRHTLAVNHSVACCRGDCWIVFMICDLFGPPWGSDLACANERQQPTTSKTNMDMT